MSSSSLRLRQMRDLARIQRDIRVHAPASPQKYLGDFQRAFRTYEGVLSERQVQEEVLAADLILIGDYHALPASQRFAANLLEQCAQPGTRPVVLGVETVFSHDQEILDSWWRREITSPELRRRIEFDQDWGYEWEPFHQLLVTARECADGIYGLDCSPRGDLRRIRSRDRHAADRLAEMREKHPRATLLALFGESHLAPSHLPRNVQRVLPQERTLTILQNVDPVYWMAAETERTMPDAVRIRENVLCVFHTPLIEKYDSYRRHLQRWTEEEDFELEN